MSTTKDKRKENQPRYSEDELRAMKVYKLTEHEWQLLSCTERHQKAWYAKFK